MARANLLLFVLFCGSYCIFTWRFGEQQLPRLERALWALTGLFVVTDVALFTYYLKLLTELALIVLAVSVILKHSGAVKWFYLAFWGVAVVRVFYGSEPVSMERIVDTRTVSRIDYANTIGFLCSLGILGLLAFWGETKKIWWRAALVGARVRQKRRAVHVPRSY